MVHSHQTIKELHFSHTIYLRCHKKTSSKTCMKLARAITEMVFLFTLSTCVGIQILSQKLHKNERNWTEKRMHIHDVPWIHQFTRHIIYPDSAADPGAPLPSPTSPISLISCSLCFFGQNRGVFGVDTSSQWKSWIHHWDYPSNRKRLVWTEHTTPFEIEGVIRQLQKEYMKLNGIADQPPFSNRMKIWNGRCRKIWWLLKKGIIEPHKGPEY